jgi:phage-related protein
MNLLYTLDPDHAWGAEQSNRPFNGYPSAKYDGIERDVCGDVSANEQGAILFPWECNWGGVYKAYPQGVTGFTMIGGGNYNRISLYSVANWGGQ